MPKSSCFETELIKASGRPRKFEKPEDLWKVFVAYARLCEKYPITVSVVSQDIKNKEGTIFSNVDRPLTKQGFMAFSGLCYKWQNFKDYYSSISNEFLYIISRIESCIEENQFSGAITGKYKENIIARLNGLTDKQTNEFTSKDTTIKIELE